MSLLARLIIAAGCAAQLASLRAAEAGSPLPAAQDITLRAFQDDDYRLAFDVMVSTGRLKEALHIARQAVQDQPRSRVWRVRLAQVAEWLGYPSWAAEQWRALFNMGDRSEETVAGVLRLAPAMSDHEVAIRAWAYRAERAPLTDVQWQEIYWLYESSAEPSQGRRFFEIQYRAKRQPLLLDLAARLATNAGEDDRALALYVERVPLEPFSMEAVLQAVFGYIRRDQWNEAQELLQAQTRRVSADASEFWRLLAQVAWERRDFLTAEQAYRRIATLPQGEASDWARLIFLARQRDAHAAVALANEAYRRFGTADHLQQVLEMYGELGDTAGQANVYRSLSPQQLERAEQHVPFLFGRAQFFMRQGKSEAGWQDLLRVRKLAPQDDNLVQALLWFMINERRQSELAQALQQYRARATSDPEFWPTYAAGYQLLGQHQEALSWHLKSLDRRSDDPVLLLNYADTLTQLGRTSMANSVRRHAWRLLQTYRPHQPEDLHALGQQPEMQAWARQALLDQSGDPGQQLVQQLALLLRAGPVDAATQEQIDNLMLGWTALKEQPALARSWLLRSYLRQSREVPAVTDAMVALQQGDVTRMDALLNRGKRSRLPPEMRYELAQALGQTPQALQTAQQGMEQSSSAEVMHERLRQQAPPNANYLQLRAFNEGLNVLERKGLQFEGRWVANPGLHVLAGGSRVGQSSSDPNFSTLAPGSDQLDLLEFRMFGVNHESRITLQQRGALERSQGMRLYRKGHLLARLNYEIGLDYRNESILSLPLRVAGYENSLYASFNYSLDKRNYLRIAPHMSRYYTQYHDELGSGRILELEAGHRLQTEFPAWRARVYALGQDFSANGSISAENLTRLPAYLQTGIGNGTISAADYFVPQSNTTVGGCVSMGDTAAGSGQRGGYRRAWRPFMDLCLRHNTVAGGGYTGLLGVAGSLIGADELAMQWQSSEGAVPGSATTHSLSIRYRHYF
jgi:predicted Zn-dependent protease